MSESPQKAWSPTRGTAPFSRYRASGAEWPTQIPAHWGWHRLGNLISVVRGEQLPTDRTQRAGETPVHGANGVIGYTDRQSTTGSALVLGYRDWDGQVRLVDGPVWVADNAWVVRPKENRVLWEFLPYLVQAVADARWAPKDARALVTKGMIENTGVGIPPLEEQSQITAFLDRECARLATVIEGKGKLLGLLAEKRDAVAWTATTKGLGSSTHLKESGWPHLGQVPSHWGICPMWTLFRLRRGVALEPGAVLPNAKPGLYPVYSANPTGPVGSLQRGYGKPYVVSDAASLAWMTDGMQAGSVLSPRQPFVFTNVCVAATPRTDEVEPRYYMHLLNALAPYRRRDDINPRLRRHEMAEIRVPVPPLAEQQAIADHIEREQGTLDDVVGRIQRQVDLLKEYRSALIRAAVTGEIDVCGGVPEGGG